jgi:hypothetical protein
LPACGGTDEGKPATVVEQVDGLGDGDGDGDGDGEGFVGVDEPSLPPQATRAINTPNVMIRVRTNRLMT